MDLGMEAFHAMIKAGIEPDSLAYTTLLKGCEQEKDWETAVQIARIAVSRPRRLFPMEELFSVLKHMSQSDQPKASMCADALRNVLRARSESEQGRPAPPGVWSGQSQRLIER